MADLATTASLFLVTRLLLALSVLVFLLFLMIGMLAGSEGIGRIAFEDYRLSFRLGTSPPRQGHRHRLDVPECRDWLHQLYSTSRSMRVLTERRTNW